MSKPQPICALCDVLATVTSPVSDRGLQTDLQTDCPACGLWVISHQDLPVLKKQTAETKGRIAEMVRQRSKKHPGVSLLVDVGFIDQARMMK